MEQRQQCPKCKNWIPATYGVILYHDKCKYCAHATSYKEGEGYRCTSCGLLFKWYKDKNGVSYAKAIKDHKKETKDKYIL